MMAEISNQSAASDTAHSAHDSLKGLKDNLIRIARLKLFLIGAKVVYHSTDRVQLTSSAVSSRTISEFIRTEKIENTKNFDFVWGI